MICHAQFTQECICKLTIYRKTRTYTPNLLPRSSCHNLSVTSNYEDSIDQDMNLLIFIAQQVTQCDHQSTIALSYHIVPYHVELA